MDPEFVMEHDDAGIDPEIEAIARQVIGAAIEVHRVLGPGFPESVYRNALSHELKLRGIEHKCEAPAPVMYKGVSVGEGKLDVLVAKSIVVELKTVESLSEVHRAQVIAYLQTMHLRLGFLINFNVVLLRDGIKRIINPHTS
jgi:GxxExxY protein